MHARLGREQRKDGGRARDRLTFAPIDDAAIATVAREVARLVKRWTLLFTDELTLPRWAGALEAEGLEYVRRGLWVKTDAMPQMSGDRPSSGAEDILIAHRRGRKHWRGGGRAAVWRGPAQEADVPRLHPAQKPEWLIGALLGLFSEPGEVILDPFAGSGTTLTVAKRMGRSSIGWEQDRGYHAVALRRIEAVREQLALPEVEAEQLALPGER